MPAVGAHYSFGQAVAEKLSPEIKEIVEKYKDVFNIGLQGPDILFYYKPYKKNTVSKYGGNIHHLKAKDFFIYAKNKAEPSDNEYLSYLIGSVCHFTLDKCCHPYINKEAPTTPAHQRLEADFDKYIMEVNNMGSKRYTMLPKLSGTTIEKIAYAYPQTNKLDVGEGIKNIRLYTYLLENKSIIETLEKIANKKGAFSPLAIDKDYQYKNEVQNLHGLLEDGVAEALEKVDSLYFSILNKGDLVGFDFNYEGIEIND